jgi:hypothetical protein
MGNQNPREKRIKSARLRNRWFRLLLNAARNDIQSREISPVYNPRGFFQGGSGRHWDRRLASFLQIVRQLFVREAVDHVLGLQ